MKTVFTKSTTNWGCYNNHGQRKQDQYIFTEDYTIEQFLATDIPLKDKGWFIRKNCELTQGELRQFAIGCALCVLPIYEAKYPGKTAPREAIEAAQKYLFGTITGEDLAVKRNAAAAAAAAAYAAYAAADAAYAAADADAAAAEPINYMHLLLEFFKEFTTVKETV